MGEGEYKLGPGDVISINVDSVPEISASYTISETGEIVFPTLLSLVKAQGLTIEGLRNLVVRLLSDYMHEPKAMVNIVEYHSHKVLMLGAFQRPGVYEIKKEKVPLMDIILQAGGLKELNENDELLIIRNNSGNNNTSALISPIRVNLQALLRDGDLSQNVMIQSGDVISMSSFFTTEKYVYVTGGGRRGAGAIRYEPGLTAFKALLRAGVVPENPQATELIIIRENSNSERFVTTKIKFNPANPNTGDVPLSPEDIVILSETTSQVIYVTGKVVKPGAQPFKEELTILQAILDAGGLSKDAVGNKVKILREGESGQIQISVDMNAILEQGEKAQNVTLAPGDIIVVPGMSLQADIMVTGKVNNPGMIPYEEGMTVMKAVFLAGGLSNNAITSQIRMMNSSGEIQPPFMLDISKTQIGEGGNLNPTLQPGDLIVVLGPATGNIVSVVGKVQRPGVIEYETGLTALQAILRTGGFAQGAARSKVKIVRGDGTQQQTIRVNLDNLVDKGDRSVDIPLLPGDIIIVPETFF